MRSSIRGAVILSIAAFAESAAQSTNADSLARAVMAVADDVAATASTPEGRAGRNPRSNASPAQRAAWDAKVDGWIASLRAIDSKLLFGRPEWVIHGVMREGLEANAGMRVCRDTASSSRTACYTASLRTLTTLPLTPEEVLRDAGQLRRSLDDEIRPLSRKVLATDDVDATRRQLRSEARFMASSREELLRATEAALAAAKAKMPQWFLEIPPDTLIIVPEPPEREATAGAPARYSRSANGRPANFVLNTYKPEERPKMTAYVAAVHEGYPGHHHQIALGRKSRPTHPVLNMFQMSGFIEGWGLYSERLADEMGIYPSDLERLWYLVHLSDAAIGMMIDPLINTGRLSREQAVDTMVVASGRPRWEAENYATRHLNTPGQIVTYAVGYHEIMRLRDEARRALGPRFDIREFHQRVLEHGDVTLPMLREAVGRWIAAKR